MISVNIQHHDLENPDAYDDHPQYLRKQDAQTSYASFGHNHGAAGGMQVIHSTLSGLTSDDHLQYLTLERANDHYAGSNHNHSGVYAPASEGVSGGNAHAHSSAEGDGAQIDYNSLLNRPPLPEGLPAGAVAYFAMSTAPSGWIKCNGAVISRTTYVNLFNAIGVAFGAGDGSTTFKLPDLRGEFLRAWDDGRGADTSRAFGTAQSDQNKSHTHNLDIPFQMAPLSPSGAGDAAVRWPWGTYTIGVTASGGDESRPRNIALLACIKY